MAPHNPLECGVCQEAFNEEGRCPRTLPCSHHFCSDCISRLILNNTKKCPFCRKSFEAKSAKDVMMNHGLLECMKYMPDITKAHKSPLQKGGASYQQRIAEVKAETERANDKLLNVLTILEKKIGDLINDAKQLKTSLNHGNTNINERVLPMIHSIIRKNDKHIEDIEAVDQDLELQLKGLKKEAGKLEIIKGKLEAANSYKEAASVMDEAEEVNIAVSEWTEELTKKVSGETSTIQIIRKDVSAIEEKIQILTEILGNYDEGDDVKLDLNIGAEASQDNPVNDPLDMSEVNQILEQQMLSSIDQKRIGTSSGARTERSKASIFPKPLQSTDARTERSEASDFPKAVQSASFFPTSLQSALIFQKPLQSAPIFQKPLQSADARTGRSEASDFPKAVQSASFFPISLQSAPILKKPLQSAPIFQKPLQSADARTGSEASNFPKAVQSVYFFPTSLQSAPIFQKPLQSVDARTGRIEASNFPKAIQSASFFPTSLQSAPIFQKPLQSADARTERSEASDFPKAVQSASFFPTSLQSAPIFQKPLQSANARTERSEASDFPKAVQSASFFPTSLQ